MTAQSASPVRPSLSARRSWATASHAGVAETQPGDLSSLGAHVDRCNGLRGRWFTARCAAESIGSFVAARFVTTVVVVALVFGVVSIVA